MGKINKIKLSFKKQPNNTGLYAVGNPKNETLIKINKKLVGSIIPSEELARIWLRENINGIMEKWNIFMDLEGG